MEVGSIVGIAVTVATFLIVGLVVYFAWRRGVDLELQWASVAGAVVLFKYNPAQVHTAEAMRLAVNKAIASICTDGPWVREQVLEALHMVKIQINPTDKFEGVVCVGGECRPGSVAGLSYVESGLVMVGLNLKGLVHEFCHVLEWKLDGAIDYEHKSWASRGLTMISDSYDPFAT